MDVEDTIAALGSAPGGAARGILRLSGPRVRETLCRLFPEEYAQEFADRAAAQVFAAELPLEAVPTRTLPCFVHFWPGDRSYTRQPAAELHTIGSPPLLEMLLRRVCECGARLAQPGEFTLRAFLAGRMDLTQAEAVLGVIESRGEEDLDVALRQLAGGLATPLHQLRERLLSLLAHLEAGLDFAEEDIEFISSTELTATLNAASKELTSLLAQIRRRGDAQDVLRVALIGPPNAGKSSLFNAIVRACANDAGSRKALVSPLPGTTRDYLTARIALNGTVCELIDTAGLEGELAAAETIGAAAQAMTERQRFHADLLLRCREFSQPPEGAPQGTPWASADAMRGEILVWTKCDLASKEHLRAVAPTEYCTSSQTGAGLAELLSAIADFSQFHGKHSPLAVGTTLVRCHESLRKADSALQAALTHAGNGHREELVALEVRAALDHLGEVVGVVYTDDILDRVFSRFCIGK